MSARLCTGEAGYIGKVSQCENGSVTPAELSETERREAISEAIRTGSGDGYYDLLEETDDYQR